MPTAICADPCQNSFPNLTILVTFSLIEPFASKKQTDETKSEAGLLIETCPTPEKPG
jgi:hypothetical protein